ncbi:hypothetical protein LX16_4699 [Stackebrandtia albiflava]|uniref:Uncharacterized protein n=1 Tax=Stackebrandtia albiflava TaxID=406432 RepID=A0A562UQN8_9ACTN|nr:hypothetical protein [Stackebrandtia albiflava]TWJ07916.1 hypothetical protein LX16_4699 [Stackebrandtia albiflava]
MLIWVIIACEVGFWVLLAAGLAARYLWRSPRLSTVLLIGVPLLDVVLLAASIIDMRGGATADLRHGLAGAYLGYSIMFGHRTIRWADRRFAHRFAGGPPVPKAPAEPWPRFRYEGVFWLQLVGAYAIAWAVTGLLIWLVGDADRTMPLVAFNAQLAKVPLIAAIWPASHLYTAIRSGGRDSEDPPDRREHGPVAASRPPGRP